MGSIQFHQFKNCLSKKNGIDNFGIEVSPLINLPVYFLIQKYFFHDIPSRYSGVPTHGKKVLGKNGIEIDTFEMELSGNELTKWN